MLTAIGLDLGTHYCRAAHLGVAGGNPQLIPNELAEPVTPAWVGLSREGQVVVGREARPAAYSSAEMPLTGIKGALASRQELWLGDRLRPAAEIAAYLLQALRRDAERTLDGPVTGAVVAVPALAGNLQRSATREAAGLAGLTAVRLINEPTAAALAHTQVGAVDRRLLVYALGAGYFEVAVIESSNQTFKTLGVKGNDQIGGNAFDRKIVDYILEGIKQKHDIDLSTDPRAFWLLTSAAEEAKIKLSAEPQANVAIPHLGQGQTDEAINLNLELTRAELEVMLHESIDLTLALVHKALAEAKLTIADVDELLLVGGSTRLPLVRQKVQEVFNKEPVFTADGIVALGAAWQTASLEAPPTPVLAESGRDEPERPKITPVAEQPPSPAPTEVATGAIPDKKPPDLAQQQLTPVQRTTRTLTEAYHLIQQKKGDEAIALLQPLHQTDQTNEQVRALLAEACHIKGWHLAKADQLTEAIKTWETGLTYHRHHEEIRAYLTKIYRRYALQLVQEHNGEAILSLIQRSKRYGVFGDWAIPLLTEGYRLKAVQLTEADKWEEAIQIFEKALEHDPENEMTRRNLAGVCLKWGKRLAKERRFEDAISIFRQGLQYEPTHKDLKQQCARLRATLKHQRGGRRKPKRKR